MLCVSRLMIEAATRAAGNPRRPVPHRFPPDRRRPLAPPYYLSPRIKRGMHGLRNRKRLVNEIMTALYSTRHSPLTTAIHFPCPLPPMPTMPGTDRSPLPRTCRWPATRIASVSPARRSPGGSCRGSSSCCGWPTATTRCWAGRWRCTTWCRMPPGRPHFLDIVYLTVGKMTRLLPEFRPARGWRCGGRWATAFRPRPPSTW